MTDVDLNYPDHVTTSARAIRNHIENAGLKINGFAMRYYSDPAFKLGAFTNPDRSVRRKAIELTKRGIDAAREAGCSLMTIWPGQDGYDYSFQSHYARLWNDEVDAIREVAQHDPDCKISIEYKPDEPRSFALLPDLATTLLAIAEVDCPNLGVTLDFAHMLYAGEQPAASAVLAACKSTIFGIHLNDGHSRRDDGLMVGSIHLQATVELLYQLHRLSFDGVIYFDTFPEASDLDPVSECIANHRRTTMLLGVAKQLADNDQLEEAMHRQDSIVAHNIVNCAISNQLANDPDPESTELTLAPADKAGI